MDNNAMYYLYIILKIADFRWEKKLNINTIEETSERFINLGSIDLLENFIAYICLSNMGRSIIDKRIENARGVFVPAIRSTIRYLSGIKIDDHTEDNLVFFREDAYKEMKQIEPTLRKEINTKRDRFLPSDSLDAFVRKFYPQNGCARREDDVKVWVRVASCFWTCGKENTGMREGDLKDCYGYYWKELRSSKIRKLIDSEILKKRGNKFILRSAGACL